MNSARQFLPSTLFVISFFSTFVLLGVLVNENLPEQVKMLNGLLLVGISCLLTWQLLSMHQQMLKTPYLLDKSAFRLHSLLSPG